MATAAFVALVIKATGIAGWLAALNLLPENVAWSVAFPATIVGQFCSHVVIGPILTKILYPFVDRLGLTPHQADDDMDAQIVVARGPH